ncbi:Calmodulin [Spironucleus salmonicida]|uniref:Calmodulin n=1 Tax=Spironucleus salmonicida TaxID=348837 RepID=V6LF14_9EUKA|nr:Calmodulin [Spironucleus salmonicida]|eukprot:EST43087.1 Calmodulin [Spironucleus salmonicida]
MGCGASNKQVTEKKNTNALLNGKTDSTCEKKPCGDKPCTNVPCTDKKCEDKPCTDKPCEDKPCDQKPTESKPMEPTCENPKNTICPYVDDETFNKIKESFKKVDDNGTGTLSVKELDAGMQEFNINMDKDDVIRLLRIIDTNFDSMLSQREYVRFMLVVIVGGQHTFDALAEFISADADLSGTISEKEFKKLAEKLYKPNVSRKVYEEAVSGVTGELSYAQFAALITKFE